MLYDPKWKPVEVKTDEWRNVLRKAADILERDGWTTGNLQTGKSRCAIGALWVAEGNDFRYAADENEAYARAETEGTAAWHLRKWLRDQEGECSEREVYEWNDDQKDAEVVIETMRYVADAV